MFAAHLLAAVLVIAFPFWDHGEAARLRTGKGPRARVHCYLRSIGVLWLLSLVVMAIVPLNTLWHPPQHMRSLSTSVSSDFLLAFVPTLMAGLMLPLIAAFFHAGTRRFMLRQFDGIDYLLPRTRMEIALFAGVSVTAGACEEVLYRGFLFHYLQTMPWHLSPTITVLLGASMFGFAHLGQGIKGILITGMAGIFLGGLYVVTDSLFVPMLVHTLIDLRATAMSYLRTLAVPMAA
jgi:uncharacterized protein